MATYSKMTALEVNWYRNAVIKMPSTEQELRYVAICRNVRFVRKAHAPFIRPSLSEQCDEPKDDSMPKRRNQIIP